jgi:transaldolase
LTSEEDLDKAKEYLYLLQQQRIDLDKICNEIQTEGVDAFRTSFKKLINAVADKVGDNPFIPQVQKS